MASSLRHRLMNRGDIAVQVICPTLFLAYPLTTNVGLMNAPCSSYNRFLGDRLGKHERIKWAAVVKSDNVIGAEKEVHRPSIIPHSAMLKNVKNGQICVADHLLHHHRDL